MSLSGEEKALGERKGVKFQAFSVVVTHRMGLVVLLSSLWLVLQ